MITAKGYSKEPIENATGIAITFGREMMMSQGGVKLFLQNFLQTMSEYEEGSYWMHKCSNLPTIEFDIIYIIVCNRLYGKVYSGGCKRYDPEEDMTGFTADGRETDILWNRIIFSGPFERCPFKRELKGFQGFRYTTKLF